MIGKWGVRARRRVLWSAAGAAAMVALLGTGHTGTAQASYTGADGLIAFVRGGDIYTIKANGVGLHRLTSSGHDSGPRWSPNGSQIAYLDRGNLWIMTAAGHSKTRLTDPAPRYSDARPSWSPNGRYLAFVQTEQGHKYGYLTRYDTVTHQLATFSTPYQSEQPTARQTKVTALPDPVAWGWALSAGPPGHPGPPGSFILVEGALSFCQSHDYCLVALGAPHQSQYKNEFPSAEDFTEMPTRLNDPDLVSEQPAVRERRAHQPGALHWRDLHEFRHRPEDRLHARTAGCVRRGLLPDRWPDRLRQGRASRPGGLRGAKRRVANGKAADRRQSAGLGAGAPESAGPPDRKPRFFSGARRRSVGDPTPASRRQEPGVTP